MSLEASQTQLLLKGGNRMEYISISSAKGVADIVERVFSIIDRKEKISKEAFSELIGKHYEDLNKIVNQYYSLFSKLMEKIASAKSKSDVTELSCYS